VGNKNVQNILFVCSANVQRSKTAEDYFSEIYPHLNFQSAGTNKKIVEKEGTNLVTEETVAWADLILVMEKKHKELIYKNIQAPIGNKIHVLAIQDIYKYYQKELIEVLVQKCGVYFP
jgi:predicted protein tyrosine phosphatase